MSLHRPDIFGMTESDLAAEFARRYGKGRFHARATLSHLYGMGSLAGLAEREEFRDNRALANGIFEDFNRALPPVARTEREGDTVKFALTLEDGYEIEAVIVPMATHTTLCVSTQAGCARGCAFCRTGSMGLGRNLSAGEITAQYLTARFFFGADIKNAVFMGMGEPFDNFGAFRAAVEILTDPRGAALLGGNVSVSTCGHVPGLERFAELAARREEGTDGRARFDLVTVAVSLHSALDGVRSSLMPVNRTWPLARLKQALLALPHSRVKDRLYFEYLVIPGLNDTAGAADALRAYLEGLTAKVNLIAFVAPERSALPSATEADVERFWRLLRERGIPAFTRKGKGAGIRASCGQLASERGPSPRTGA